MHSNKIDHTNLKKKLKKSKKTPKKHVLGGVYAI
jgi:hypothetical protein